MLKLPLSPSYPTLSTMRWISLVRSRGDNDSQTGAYPAEAVLVAHGVCADGSRVVLGLMLGGRESSASWKAFLHDLADRGLNEPALVIGDGNGGLIRAMKDVWPDVPRQRCVAHKIRNVLNRVPKKEQATVKREVAKIFYAPCMEEAKQRAERFIAQYGKQYAMACETLCRDLHDCLTFYRFPQAHWKRLRTSNVIERSFREVRRRTRVVGRFPNELSALTLVFATLEEDRLKWRGLRMDNELRADIEEAQEDVKQKICLESRPLTPICRQPNFQQPERWIAISTKLRDAPQS